jgi:hypothetical protein
MFSAPGLLVQVQVYPLIVCVVVTVKAVALPVAVHVTFSDCA